MARRLKSISREIAEKRNLQYSTVDDVLRSQFKFMRYSFEHGHEYQAIYLGKFVRSTKRTIRHINKMVKIMTNLILREERRKEIIKLMEHNEML